MLYSIIGTDIKDSLQKRLSVRQAHLARVQALQDQGRLVLAGPNPAIESNNPIEAGFTGSVIIAEFSSLQEANDWIQDDPYTKAGVYESITVKPFKKLFPK